MKKHMRFWGLSWTSELVGLFIAWLCCTLVPLVAILVISHLKPNWIVNGTGISIVITWGVLLLASSLILGYSVGLNKYWKQSFEMIAAGTIAMLAWTVVTFDTSINGPVGDATVRQNVLIIATPWALFLAIMIYTGAAVGVIVRKARRRRSK